MSLAQTRLEKDFQKFHLKNPAVWTEFKRYAFEAIESGRQHYSASFIVNKIRWDSAINTSKTNAFKIANATSPYYARLFHKSFPAYEGFFKTFGFESDIKEQESKVRQAELAL
jgi:hypothetical protein|tara:strand:+ start:266 stop:604 length:339 start_codon:yes stop_codon:yes gene_type:complete